MGEQRKHLEPGVIEASWWHRLPDGRFHCDLCPRGCRLRPGQRGFCFVREAREAGVVLSSYGRASGFCVDPVEKKPLNHFFPGTSILSFGTAGCNLGCRFCQNWAISKARVADGLSDWAEPEAVVAAAGRTGCHSIAFTYNDPVVFAEYAIDVATVAREQGIRTVAVTAGYISPAARPEFFGNLDAANVDLKAFSPEFYRKLCFAALEPVLDTLAWIHRETDVWLEVTTLLIPDHNDSHDEIARLCDWYLETLGPAVPLHFTAFHPEWRLSHVPATPARTLQSARRQAKAAGIHHVYTGNISDPEGASTWCPGCGRCVIERHGYTLGAWHLNASGNCGFCGSAIAGRFESQPGSWGPRRERVVISRTRC